MRVSDLRRILEKLPDNVEIRVEACNSDEPPTSIDDVAFDNTFEVVIIYPQW